MSCDKVVLDASGRASQNLYFFDFQKNAVDVSVGENVEGNDAGLC
jgi:hypothetical protein